MKYMLSISKNDSGKFCGGVRYTTDAPDIMKAHKKAVQDSKKVYKDVSDSEIVVIEVEELGESAATGEGCECK